MMVAFVLGEVAAYQMGMTVWFIIAAALFVFHRKLCPMKHKAHSFSPAVIKTAEGRVDSDFQTDAERVWNWKDPMMCRVFLLFFCFLAGWGRMTVEMRPDALERMVTQKGGSAEVAVSGTLDSISEKNGWCTMILTGVEIEDESVRKVLISCKSDLLEMCEEKILPLCGSQIHLTGTAEFLEEARNPGQFSYRMYYRGLGIRNRVRRIGFLFQKEKVPLSEVRQNASGRTRRLFFRKSVFQKMQGFSRQFCWGINPGYRKSCANGFRIMGLHIFWQSAGFMSL